MKVLLHCSGSIVNFLNFVFIKKTPPHSGGVFGVAVKDYRAAGVLKEKVSSATRYLPALMKLTLTV